MHKIKWEKMFYLYKNTQIQQFSPKNKKISIFSKKLRTSLKTNIILLLLTNDGIQNSVSVFYYNFFSL